MMKISRKIKGSKCKIVLEDGTEFRPQTIAVAIDGDHAMCTLIGNSLVREKDQVVRFSVGFILEDLEDA